MPSQTLIDGSDVGEEEMAEADAVGIAVNAWMQQILRHA